MVDNNNTKSQQQEQRRLAKTSIPWARSVALLGSLGLTSSGLAIADTHRPNEVNEPFETSADYLAPTESRPHHRSSPSAVPHLDPAKAASSQPNFSPLRSSQSVPLTSPSAENNLMQPQVPPPASPPAIVAPAPASAPTMAESLLKPAPSSTADAPERAVPAEIAADESVPQGYNSVFIDSTDYSVGATQAPNVVFSDRSSGCEIKVTGGQINPGACNGNATNATGETASTSSQGGNGVQVGPVTVNSRGVSLGNTTIVSREALNERLRPLNVLRRGRADYVFPLSTPAPISSLFGWRMHPIQQTWRFHAGIDLAAPTGTPVLATRSGRVAVSDYLGGYGLTVILRHGDGDLESRYAHLSQLAVKPGEWVEQGEVIGLVGSTGNSTGPHLHFEIRQLTSQGWVAVDPIEVVEHGLANLMELLDNPRLALGRPTPSTEPVDDALPVDYPFRPAQPNAS